MYFEVCTQSFYIGMFSLGYDQIIIRVYTVSLSFRIYYTSFSFGKIIQLYSENKKQTVQITWKMANDIIVIDDK